MKTTFRQYRSAAVTMWGEAGGFAYDAWREVAHDVFDDQVPEALPIVIGITAYGKCLALTRHTGSGAGGPRITLASNLFARGTGAVRDVLIHEGLHVHLGLIGDDSKHNGAPWYREVQRLSPTVLGHPLDLRRDMGRRSVRVPNPKYGNGDSRRTVVRKVVVADSSAAHADVARWPTPFRPVGWDAGSAIDCPSY